MIPDMILWRGKPFVKCSPKTLETFGAMLFDPYLVHILPFFPSFKLMLDQPPADSEDSDSCINDF